MFRTIKLMLAFLLAFALYAASASAQALDDFWFKVTASSTGYTIDSNTGFIKKASIKTTAYMHLVWDNVNSEYDFEIYTNVGTAASPNWQSTYDDSFSTEGANEAIATDAYFEFNLASNYFGGYATCLITLKKNGAGAVTGATINSLGGETVDAQIGGNDFRGGLTIRSSKVAEAKLPFVP